ncbi:kinesin-like protein KIF11 [Zophobas morio]|uniref:kinesin-like protein KIF11 n=1 Tax=Zophobas morio TaxID=2755281 RepID=UPI003082EE76
MSPPDKKAHSPVKVYLLQRPLNAREKEQKCFNVVHAAQAREVVLKNGVTKRKFTCDHFFGPETTQSELYNATIAPMINNVVAGNNCTLFAYGPTGTGKTHAMFGEMKPGEEINSRMDESVGLILRASHNLFAELSKLSIRTEYTVRTSFVEIHNEEVHDLFRDNVALRMYDDPLLKGSVCLKELRTVTVFNTANVVEWITIGLQARQKNAANHNIRNLRSHVIFTFLVSVREIDGRGDEIIRSGRLRLLDLAGSESVGRERARDSGNVNRSIHTLPRMIKAIAQKMQYVPYRESKLTRILQDSLSGNTKTAMLATFSPSSGSWEDTIATLELGQLAKTIVTNTYVNVDKKQVNLLKELDDELDRLKSELAAAKRREGVFVSNQAFKQMTDDTNNNNQKVLELVGKIAELANHKSSIDLQYRSLELSFHKTKDFLETVQQRIVETRKALLNQEVTLNAVTEKHKDTADFTKTLLDVCKRSTRNEEIYYRKYQQTTATNKENAQKSKEMLSILNSCLQDIADETQRTSAENLAAINQTQEDLVALSKDTSDGACCMDLIASDMRSYADNYNLTLNELAQNDSNCRLKTLQDVTSGTFEHDLAHLGTQKEIRDTMEAIKLEYETDLRDMALHSENTSHNVQKLAEENEALIKIARTHFSKKKSQLRERREAIYEEKRKNDAAIRHAKEEIARADKEKQALLERAAILEANIAKVKAIKEQNANMVLVPVRQSVNDYLEQPRKIVNTSMAKIENVLQEVESNQSLVHTQAESDRSAVHQAVKEMEATVKENLTQRNEELRDVLQTGRSSLVNTARHNVAEKTLPTLGRVDDTFTQLSGNLVQRNVNLQTRSADAAQELNECYEGIQSVGHAGDTPAKQTYKYPKGISVPRLNMNGDAHSPNGSDK